jgi:hypothetical protein
MTTVKIDPAIKQAPQVASKMPNCRLSENPFDIIGILIMQRKTFRYKQQKIIEE